MYVEGIVMGWIWVLVCVGFLIVGLFAINNDNPKPFQVIGWVFTILSSIIKVPVLYLI